MLYGNDTSLFTDETADYLKQTKLDIVSLDGTFGKKDGQYFRHMGFKDIINIKKEFTDSGISKKNALFVVTHFSHFINMLHEEIEEYFKPYGIIPAYDGMVIEK
jgi:phosphoribosyl 1,2-cyclic phosphate phosphodiesterase